MKWDAWVAIPSYFVMALVLVVLALLVAEVHKLRIRPLPPLIVPQPERCASCGGVLSKDDTPVEFFHVPVPVSTLNSAQPLTVRFKVCQFCVAAVQV